MGEAGKPQVYSIAAHRGFADALVAGLVPRYADAETGLARLTVLLPSSRAARTLSEAFIRHAGATGSSGLLMPRMVQVGDLDLDEALGPLFDSLGAGAAIPPAADPTRRWLRLAQLLPEAMATLGRQPMAAPANLRMARDIARAMDRLAVEDVHPASLWSEPVMQAMEEQAGHWMENSKLFFLVQQAWQAELAERGEIDGASRRNLLFREAARRMRNSRPATPFIAAGVTSAAPALAELLRTVSLLPQGAVILPDLDLSLSEEAWDEIGSADAQGAQTPFGTGDAVTHPQYHLKLLLNRMNVARGEVQPWHRAGLSKGPPERSHAISSLFLPPLASRVWVELPAEKRRLSGVRLLETANPEEEAQAVALLVREVLEVPAKRVAVVTPDRGLAARIVQHLRRWNIAADDSAGRPLPQTAAGRVLLLLAELVAEQAAPVALLALLEHPLVAAGEGRREWLAGARKFERKLRGPRKSPGLEPLRIVAADAGVIEWFGQAETILAPLLEVRVLTLADWLDLLSNTGEALCGENWWAREDGRDLAAFIEELRLHSRAAPIALQADELPGVLRDAMDLVAVRPPYGGHPRVAIYGLLEARMTRADLVICAGLNEGTWPPRPSPDPLLAPAILRALGVPGADFRIGLSAHDLAGMLGAPEVVLSRARRDTSGPAIPSRFVLRVRALLGEKLAAEHECAELADWARVMDAGLPSERYAQPRPCPGAAQRPDAISVTALDRLRSDPYQYYASKILDLDELKGLDAEPGPDWQGQLAHTILEQWHDGQGTLADLATRHLEELDAHPLLRALWRPRLLGALEWVEAEIAANPARKPAKWEKWGEIRRHGVRVFGKADRIDVMADGTLAVVDYKTGTVPSKKMVEQGFALQLGTLGLIARDGGFDGLQGEPSAFEYWRFGKNSASETGFGEATTPLKVGKARSGVSPDEFLPATEAFLDEAIGKWLIGNEPFTARENPAVKVYATYDQLMRLDEWLGREDDGE